MSPDSEGLGAAVVAGVGSSLTQSSGISYFSRHAKTCLMGTYVNNELWRFKSSRFKATSLTFN